MRKEKGGKDERKRKEEDGEKEDDDYPLASSSFLMSFLILNCSTLCLWSVSIFAL